MTDVLVTPFRDAACLRPVLQRPPAPKRLAPTRHAKVLQSSRAPAQLSLFGGPERR